MGSRYPQNLTLQLRSKIDRFEELGIHKDNLEKEKEDIEHSKALYADNMYRHEQKRDELGDLLQQAHRRMGEIEEKISSSAASFFSVERAGVGVKVDSDDARRRLEDFSSCFIVGKLWCLEMVNSIEVLEDIGVLDFGMWF